MFRCSREVYGCMKHWEISLHDTAWEGAGLGKRGEAGLSAARGDPQGRDGQEEWFREGLAQADGSQRLGTGDSSIRDSSSFSFSFLAVDRSYHDLDVMNSALVLKGSIQRLAVDYTPSWRFFWRLFSGSATWPLQVYDPSTSRWRQEA